MTWYTMNENVICSSKNETKTTQEIVNFINSRFGFAFAPYTEGRGFITEGNDPCFDCMVHVDINKANKDKYCVLFSYGYERKMGKKIGRVILWILLVIPVSISIFSLAYSSFCSLKSLY